ncbi:hypothetical protein [Novipirellula galeiformis]|nr:hypothetical protein [Novipirellula galeiformis]
MVSSGLAAVAKQATGKTHYPLGTAYSGGYGEQALLGYASMKLKHDPADPVVRQGVQAALAIVRKLSDRDPGGDNSKTVYAASVATLLLAEVDREAYRKELERLAQYFNKVQYPGGGYGYLHEHLGDISQTQYAMLALWTLDRVGVVIDYVGVAKTIAWLLRVQDPGGGWPYMGKDSGRVGQRVKQDGVTASMAVAGGSALLIAGDILRLWGDGSSGNDPKVVGLPKAVHLFVEGLDNASIKRPELPKEPLLAAIRDCDAWLSANSPDPGKLKSRWPYYQLYTLERYESFKEIAFQLEKDPSPAWYNGGVGFLKSTQANGAGWPARSYTTAPVTSAFALLFLSRSTQKAIDQASSGATAGGWGLPKDTTAIKVEGTQIKGAAPANEVNDLLDMLSEDGGGGLEGKSIPDDLKLDPDPKKRAAQIDRLERLVRGSQSWQARRVAARLLGQSDELRVVPTLIFALSDPDPSVPRYARDGLRFISRRFEGFGMPDKPNKGEVAEAQRQWRDWYRKSNPGYIFLDYDL